MEKKRKISKKTVLKIITVVLAVILVAFWACLAYLHLNASDSGSWAEAGVKFIAHRGYSNKYFQNTLQAFDAAADEIFFQGIETDIRRTADGVFVCSHDDDPFVDKSVKISSSNYGDIKNLPLDLSKAEEGVDITAVYCISTLSEYLNVLRRCRKTAFIELKTDFGKAEAIELTKEVFAVLSYSSVVFCSFYKDVLDIIYNEYPYADIQLFTSKKFNAFLYTQLGYNICVNKKILKNDAAIKRSHKKDCWIGAYTVNDADEAKRLMKMGIDYITCDGVIEGL